jgi:hypothetical protein
MDWVELFGLPGVFHAHFGVAGAEFARGFDVGKEHGYNGLYRLSTQSKLPFGCLT